MALEAIAEAGIEHVKVRVLPDGRMTRRDAARYLGRSEKTLAMWQLEGKGPESLLVGGRRFYFRQILDEFISGKVAVALVAFVVGFISLATVLVGIA